MDNFIYLDTARVGRPSQTTFLAATDSFAMAAEEGGSAYFDRFLRQGLSDCPMWMQSRYYGLKSWRGIGGLKADLRSLIGGTDDLPVLLANRTAQLMELAARLFYPRCHNVLTCDLGWPAYQTILETAAIRHAGCVTVLPLHEMVFGGRATADEVVEAIVETYVGQNCDGLFLPAVSNLGVKLPIPEIVQRIEAVGIVRFVVVDGAQEFCHTATELASDYCDLYLAGCHKWLAGHHPMGVGFYGRRRSREFIDTVLASLVEAGIVDDPLLRFAEQIESGRTNTYKETVNLAGLFTGQAAVAEAIESNRPHANPAAREANRELVARAVSEAGWQAEEIDPDLRSAILLARSERNSVRQADPAILRSAFRDCGVGLTAYDNGRVRLSIPKAPMCDVQVEQVRNAFYSSLLKPIFRTFTLCT